jgi:hypothetical protein
MPSLEKGVTGKYLVVLPVSTDLNVTDQYREPLELKACKRRPMGWGTGFRRDTKMTKTIVLAALAFAFAAALDVGPELAIVFQQH